MKTKITFSVLFIIASSFVLQIKAQQVGNGRAISVPTDDFNTPILSGFYQTGSDQVGFPNNADWNHLLVLRHSNPQNNYQFQLASSYFENDRAFFRKIAEDGIVGKNSSWHEIATRGSNIFVGNQFINGNVGIGTDSPQEKLDVTGNFMLRNGSFIQSPGHFLFLGHLGNNNTRLRISTNELYGAYMDYSHNLYIRTTDQNDIMTFMQDGRIGIGTNSPQEKLDVTGNFTLRDGSFFQSPGHFLFLGHVGNNNTRLRISTNEISGAYMDYSHDLFIRSIDENNIMTFKQDGKIGIGIDNPQNKLEVAGTIRAKEVKIEATGWADFVFSEEYNLPSLTEVKKHIDEKKHLPGIPSEEEVKENGINMGEMQAKLLQKIEELTLYTIDQQKMINRLNQKIEELESKIQ